MIHELVQVYHHAPAVRIDCRVLDEQSFCTGVGHGRHGLPYNNPLQGPVCRNLPHLARQLKHDLLQVNDLTVGLAGLPDQEIRKLFIQGFT